jgi:endonuclease G, mitochondrial
MSKYMKIDNSIIQSTIERYQQREQQRVGHLQKLQETGIFSADTPERVAMRLERIARHPLTSITIDRDERSTVARSEALSEEEFRQLVQERSFGQNDLMPVNYLEYALRVAQSVGRVIIRNSSRRLVGYGTGSMVSPELMMTNNHVLSTVQAAQFGLIEFNYQSDLDGKIRQSQSYELDPDTFFISDVGLDYTIVAIKPSPSDRPPVANFGWNRIIEEQGKVIIGEYVNIIQHPAGEPKQLALRENRVVDLLPDFLQYMTDTAPGSSGAPVFNDQWELVGLHHSGVPQRDDLRNIIAIDGTIWQPEMGESRVKWLANEGVRIGRIAQHLKQQNLSIERRRLRDRLFVAMPDRNEQIDSDAAGFFNPKSTETMSTPTPSDRSITWTIPLQVTVSLGQVGMSVPATGVTPPRGNALQQSLAADSQLQQELQILEQARRGTIPYFDRVVDEQNRNNYYSALTGTIDSLDSKQLFKKLSDLLVSTHTTKLTYKPSVQLYPWVDLQPDLKIRSIYSRQEFTPEEIIQEDLLIDREKKARLQELMSVEASNQIVDFREELDLLEAQMLYNCEHVVPQSWFGKAEPMRGDLHHLFACESNCNSFRNNTPYFDFPDFEEVTRTNCGKTERDRFKFEPSNGKGEVARATLYFLLRYPGKINNTIEEYKSDRLTMLLQWSQEHPVTEHERHRNMAIFKKQGNRNPLIDFPEWARKIDFSLGLG